jgi:hypothetical protein
MINAMVLLKLVTGYDNMRQSIRVIQTWTIVSRYTPMLVDDVTY